MPDGGPIERLFDWVAESLCIAADPFIPGDDRDQLWRLADFRRPGQLCRFLLLEEGAEQCAGLDASE